MEQEIYIIDDSWENIEHIKNIFRKEKTYRFKGIETT